MRFKSILFVFVILFATQFVFAADLPEVKPDSNAPRSAIPGVYQWNLAPLFANDQAWEQARTKLLAATPGLARYKGKLKDPASLMACLKLYFQLHRDANYVTLYSNLRQNVALTDDAAGTMVDKGLAAMNELMQTAGFIRQELLAIPAGTIQAAYRKLPALAEYKSYIENLRRRASRILSPDAEKVLGILGDNLWAEIDLNEIYSSSEKAYAAMRSDIPFPKVKDDNGNEVQLAFSNLSTFRLSQNRDVRKGAFDSYLGALRQFRHVFAAAYAGQIDLDVNYARARGYDTALAAYMDKDNIPPAVYENLVKTVNANLPLLHRYVELRKKLLQLPEIRIYDLAVALTPSVEEDTPYSKARASILEALKPLGTEYNKVLAEGLDPANGWLDLYPHKDKDSGGFSASVYGAHPFVLMNYQNTFNDMFTIAHEYGHSLHSYLSMNNQPYSSSRYVMMLAEIASTCNETLLENYELANATDPVKKAYILISRLEKIRTTIFRQTMFAEFERETHRLVESGTPITASLLEKTYLDLVKRYHGPGFTVGANDGMEWAGVPHFYYKYYVWVYATGLASGIDIAERISTQGAQAAEAYLTMLKGGNSEAPLNLLKKAGVDLTKPDAIQASMKVFEQTLNEVEKLMAK